MQNTQKRLNVLLFKTMTNTNITGSLDILYNIVTESNINIEFNEFMDTMRQYIEKFSDRNQQSAFTAFYWRRMSNGEVKTLYGDTSLIDATDSYIELLKADYGVK